MASSPLASALCAEAGLWDDHSPDHPTITSLIDGPNNADRNATPQNILNIAALSPMAIVFALASDKAHLCVAHILTRCPQDPATPQDGDDLLVGLVGNDFNTAVPVVFEEGAMARANLINCHTTNDHFLGPLCHAVAPAVFRAGPHMTHTTRAQDTSQIRAVFLS